MELQRLYPRPGVTTPEHAASRLELGSRAPTGRPYLVLNMVATADGKATIDGRTRALGNEADRVVFHHLRTQVDAVLAGAGTVRTERYGRLIKEPALRDKRVHEGLAADPLAVVASARLDLSTDIPLLADPESRVLILTSSDAHLHGAQADVQYLRPPTGALVGEVGPGGAARFRLGPLLELLRADHGVRSVLCEGGPTLNEMLLAEGVVDELFLCVAPLLAGGTGAPTIVVGPGLPEPAAMQLVWAYESESHLLLRYRLKSS